MHDKEMVNSSLTLVGRPDICSEHVSDILSSENHGKITIKQLHFQQHFELHVGRCGLPRITQQKFYEPIQFCCQEGTYFWNWISTAVVSELYQIASLRPVLVELIQIWFTVWYQTSHQKVSLHPVYRSESARFQLCKILLCRKFLKLQPWWPF